MVVIEFEMTGYPALRDLLRKGDDFFITMTPEVLTANPSGLERGLDLDNPVERYVLFKWVCKWKRINIVPAQEDSMGFRTYKVHFPAGYLDNQYAIDDLLSLDA